MSAGPTRSVGAAPAAERSHVDVRWDALCDHGNLTRRQLLIWGGDRVAAGAPVFAEGVLLHIHGALDVRRFQAALQAVLDESDALRSVVNDVEGRPVQRVRAPVPVTVEVVDLAGRDDASRTLEAVARERVARVAGIDTRFDTILVRLGPEHWVWVLTQHQLVSDAWSFRLVCDRVAAYYESAASARTVPMEPPAPFAEYLAYERGLRASARAASAREYWRGHYGDAATAPATPLSADPRQATAIARVVRRLDRATASRLAALATRAGSYDVGVFAIAASLVAAHLYRSAGSRDVVFDVPFANRSSARFKRTIGSFMSVCPVRIAVDGSDTFDAVFQRLLRAAWEASRHQWYADRVGRPPQPYDVLVNIYRHEIAGRTFASMPLRIDWPAPTHRFAGLTIVIADFGATGAPVLAIDGNLATFGPDARADLVRDLERLLAQCLADPTSRIDARPVTTVRADGAAVPTVWARFVQQAARTPTTVAVRMQGSATTYGDLRRRADAVAAALTAHGVQPRTVVAVWGERGVHVIAAMLGVFRVGAVYLPIDPRWPARRIREVLERSGARVVLTPDDRPAPLANGQHDVVAWDVVSTARMPLACGAPRDGGVAHPASARPTDLAYVVYTSGSTGLPKGALVDHAALLNHLDAKIDLLSLGRDDRVAQTAAVSFDVSIWQCLAALLVGGCVEIVPDDAVRDPERMLGVLAQTGITVLEVVPAVLDLVLAAERPDGPGPAHALAGMRWLVVTGDALAPELCRRWLRRFPMVPIVNAYGPTECADDVAHYVLRTPPPADAVRVPIGRPIANVSLQVVDATFRPLPMGEVGELVVSGVAVGRGYLGDPERTAAAFVESPAGIRCYRTGDRGREREDGTFECLGRLDDQVKIRGVRVEPGEVAAVLSQHPAVRQVAVVAEAAPGGDRRLVAYVVLAGTGDANDRAATADVIAALRDFAGERLPAAAVPAVVTMLAALPLDANGKVDRSALPGVVPEPAIVTGTGLVQTGMEEVITGIWRELLGVPIVGRDDDFFALGGDSLLVYHMLARVHGELGVTIDAATFLDRPSIATITTSAAFAAHAASAFRPDVDARAYARELAAIEALSEAEVARLLAEPTSAGDGMGVAS